MERFLSILPINLCKIITQWESANRRFSCGNSWHRRARINIGSMAIIVIMSFAAVCWARADEALPSQEQALARALENHPDILAAKAKVALADADLYGKRMEVSRQVLGLYGSLKKLDAQIDASKSALNRSKAEFERSKEAGAKGALDQSTKDKLAAEVQAAEGQLVQTLGQREQAEKELGLVIGTVAPAAEAVSPNKAATAARQTPQGPIVYKMRIAQEKPIKLTFGEMPLQELMKHLSDTTGIMFSVQRGVLEGAGFTADMPVTFHTNEVPLHAALQAFEDAYPELQFVLRDYGVLVTTRDYAQGHGYVPVLEPAKSR